MFNNMAVISLFIFIVAIALFGSSAPLAGPMAAEGGRLKPTDNKISNILFARLASIIFIVCALLAYNTLHLEYIGQGLGLFSGYFTISTMSLSTIIFLFLISSSILVPFYSSVERQESSQWSGPIVAEYSLLLIFSTVGGALLLTSSDLISMYLGIELQSFALYILATLYYDNKEATAAGLKYFLLGGLSSCFILFGCALIYASTGLTNLDSLYSLTHTLAANGLLNLDSLVSASLPISLGDVYGVLSEGEGTLILGIIFILFGFLFKIAAAPLHQWAPDVYDGVPTVVTTWLTIIPKISIIIFLLTLLSALPSSLQELDNFQDSSNVFIYIQNLLLASALLSLLLGSIVGLAQFRVKRLLAYSTISHVGFMLLLLAISLNTRGTEFSVESLMFYLFQYSLTSLNTFLILLAFGILLNNSRKDSGLSSITGGSHKLGGDIKYIEELKGQFIRNPILAISLSLSLFSMAGVPPLVGFFAKMNVLNASLNSGLYFIAFVAVVVSVISAVYYLTIIKTMHFTLFTSPAHKGDELESTAYSAVTFNQKVMAEKENSYTALSGNIISNLHATLISLITLFLLFFILNPDFILNSVLLLALTIYPI